MFPLCFVHIVARKWPQSWPHFMNNLWFLDDGFSGIPNQVGKWIGFGTVFSGMGIRDYWSVLSNLVLYRWEAFQFWFYTFEWVPTYTVLSLTFPDKKNPLKVSNYGEIGRRVKAELPEWSIIDLIIDPIIDSFSLNPPINLPVIEQCRLWSTPLRNKEVSLWTFVRFVGRFLKHGL